MSLMMMRAALIARNALPPQYQRVEYIENTSNSYLNLNQNIKATFTTKIVFSITTWNDTYGFCYGQWDDYALGFRNEKIVAAGGRANTQALVTTSLNTLYNIEQHCGNLKINGTTYTIWGSGEENASGRPLFLFVNGLNSITPYIQWCVKAKIYSFSIEDNGQRTLNLIPCRRKSDNKPGMWDTVSKTFFTNSGTGADFTLGPDVL